MRPTESLYEIKMPVFTEDDESTEYDVDTKKSKRRGQDDSVQNVDVDCILHIDDYSNS